MEAINRVRALYSRETRLQAATKHARAATNAALLDAVRNHEVEYERLARGVVPPATRGDDIQDVRAERRRVAASFRKRVERDRRHACSRIESESPLSDASREHTMAGRETTAMPTESYLRRRIVEEYEPAVPPAEDLGEDGFGDDHDLDDEPPCGIGGDEELEGDGPEGE